jgi:putative membrane protein
MKRFDWNSMRAPCRAIGGGLAFAAVTASRAASAQERTAEWGWSMHPMPWMWGLWGLGMILMMLIFWALVITGIVLLIRWFVRAGGPASHDRALAILRERYARGEIDKNEFESKQRDLR